MHSSLQSCIENIELAAYDIPAHARTTAMHDYQLLFWRLSPHAVLSGFLH